MPILLNGLLFQMVVVYDNRQAQETKLESNKKLGIIFTSYAINMMSNSPGLIDDALLLVDNTAPI